MNTMRTKDLFPLPNDAPVFENQFRREIYMTVSSTRTQKSKAVLAALVLAIAAPPLHAARAAADSTTEQTPQLTEVIVTGTRQGGLSAAESPAPIQILSAEA